MLNFENKSVIEFEADGDCNMDRGDFNAEFP